MCDGDFTSEDIDAAKKYLIGAYNSNYDSLGATEEYYTMQLILGTDTSVEEMAKEIENVTRDEIITAARGMKLDTVYYLDKEAE